MRNLKNRTRVKTILTNPLGLFLIQHSLTLYTMTKERGRNQVAVWLSRCMEEAILGDF